MARSRKAVKIMGGSAPSPLGREQGYAGSRNAGRAEPWMTLAASDRACDWFPLQALIKR
jgi:hypothetical protein